MSVSGKEQSSFHLLALRGKDSNDCLYQSVVTVGVAPFRDLGGRSPMVDAVRLTNMTWLVLLTELGALAATTSVILVLLIAQPRVFYSMANDGLIPRVFAKVHPVHKVSDPLSVSTFM